MLNSSRSVLELGEAECAVSETGYLKNLDDFRNVPVGLGVGGTPILLGEVARIQIGPGIRGGISELDAAYLLLHRRELRKASKSWCKSSSSTAK
jgi:Cu/Ag efflux pump CusA